MGVRLGKVINQNVRFKSYFLYYIFSLISTIDRKISVSAEISVSVCVSVSVYLTLLVAAEISKNELKTKIFAEKILNFF